MKQSYNAGDLFCGAGLLTTAILEVFEELGIARGTMYLFATETYEEAQNDITTPKVKRLNEQNIYLVVRDEIKHKRFPKDTNVIGFTAFIKEELPNHRARWASLLKR